MVEAGSMAAIRSANRYDAQAPVANLTADSETFLHYARAMFEEWVAAALKHAKMSQAELARRLESEFQISVDRAAVNKVTKGKRDLTAKELYAICAITEFPLPNPGLGEAGEAEATPPPPAGISLEDHERSKLMLAKFVETIADVDGALEIIEFLDKESRLPQDASAKQADIPALLLQAEIIAKYAKGKSAQKNK